MITWWALLLKKALITPPQSGGLDGCEQFQGLPVYYILVENGASVNVASCPNKFTPLHFVVFNSKPQSSVNWGFIIELLIAHNAEIHTTTQDGKTALDFAQGKKNCKNYKGDNILVW